MNYKDITGKIIDKLSDTLRSRRSLKKRLRDCEMYLTSVEGYELDKEHIDKINQDIAFVRYHSKKGNWKHKGLLSERMGQLENQLMGYRNQNYSFKGFNAPPKINNIISIAEGEIKNYEARLSKINEIIDDNMLVSTKDIDELCYTKEILERNYNLRKKCKENESLKNLRDEVLNKIKTKASAKEYLFEKSMKIAKIIQQQNNGNGHHNKHFSSDSNYQYMFRLNNGNGLVDSLQVEMRKWGGEYQPLKMKKGLNGNRHSTYDGYDEELYNSALDAFLEENCSVSG